MFSLRTIMPALLIAAVTSVAAVVWTAAPAQAAAADQVAASSEVVQYRLAKWKTTHAAGGQAEKLVKTLKTLRCEVKVGSHGGHTDVQYRCAKWQALALKSHESAHQWESWLKKYGFETKHEH
jgi:hypothetical protein